MMKKKRPQTQNDPEVFRVVHCFITMFYLPVDLLLVVSAKVDHGEAFLVAPLAS